MKERKKEHPSEKSAAKGNSSKVVSNHSKPNFREKLFSEGPQALSEAELIAIILNTGTKNYSVAELASFIVKEIKVDGLLDIDASTLSNFRGMGKAKAARLVAAVELGKRVLKSKALDSARITSPDDVARFLLPLVKGRVFESLFVISISSSGRVVSWKEISKGGVDFLETDVSLVLREPVREGVKRIIVAHNHPSGDVKPSKADIDFTDRLRKACDTLGITLLDHIILSGKADAESPSYGTDFLSFVEEGLL